MIDKTTDLFNQLFAARNNPAEIERIQAENLEPFPLSYDMDGVTVLGLFRPRRGQPEVICFDRGSLVAVRPEDF